MPFLSPNQQRESTEGNSSSITIDNNTDNNNNYYYSNSNTNIYKAVYIAGDDNWSYIQTLSALDVLRWCTLQIYILLTY